MNNHIFQKVNNENVAYWLGFLAADGSIHSNKLEIGLSAKDLSHLKKFKSFVGYEGSITERETLCTTNGKSYPSCYLTIRNNDIIDDLSQYSIVPDKSHQNIDFLSFIPEEYKIPFILGYFDGDGWFTNTEKNSAFGFCGNENLIKSISIYLKNYFNWDQFNCHQYSKSLITFYIATQSREKILQFINLYLSYKDRCDLLNRKQDIALNLKEKLEMAMQKAQQPKERIIKLNKICPICGKAFHGRSEQIYCSQVCVHKNQQKTERPNRETLKNEIRKFSFLQLGKKYGVSDNAIRKWCKAYNLPYKKSDINHYSAEEWINI